LVDANPRPEPKLRKRNLHQPETFLRQQGNQTREILGIDNGQSTIDNRQSTIDNRQSTIKNRQSTIDNQKSTIKNSQSKMA